MLTDCEEGFADPHEVRHYATDLLDAIRQDADRDEARPQRGRVVTIQARYSGVCPDCGERWQPGDMTRSDQLNDVGMALWTPARTGEASCPTCTLIHPEGACDR